MGDVWPIVVGNLGQKRQGQLFVSVQSSANGSEAGALADKRDIKANHAVFLFTVFLFLFNHMEK